VNQPRQEFRITFQADCEEFTLEIRASDTDTVIQSFTIPSILDGLHLYRGLRKAIRWYLLEGHGDVTDMPEATKNGILRILDEPVPPNERAV